MEIQTIDAEHRGLYGLLIGLVQPRPIALVSTISPRGVPNLAPFSFFNLVSGNPPVVALGPAQDAQGNDKHTLANLQATGEFTVAIVTSDLVERAVACASPVGPEVSEFDFSGLTAQPARLVAPARVKEAKAHLECTVRDVLRLGAGPSGGNLVLGDVVGLQVDDTVLDPDGRVDPRLLQAVGRLGGRAYTTVKDPFDLTIPPPDNRD